MLAVGTPAPAFVLQDQNEKPHTLEEYKGKWLLLYFYPKDDTPGCTKESCGFRDLYHELREQNCTVLGVSKDTIASHKKFSDKFNLPFSLLADETESLRDAYQTPKSRVSYLIDPEGNIAQFYGNVDTEKHPAQVLEALTTHTY